MFKALKNLKIDYRNQITTYQLNNNRTELIGQEKVNMK